MPRDERFQLWHELVVVAKCEPRLDPVFQRGHVQLLQPLDLVLCEALIREIRERCSAPQRERTAELIRGTCVIPGFECGPAFREQPLEAVAVEFAWLER